MAAPTEVTAVEHRLLELYRLRDAVRLQYDTRRRALQQAIGGRRNGRNTLRAECEDRRRLLRALEDEIADAERVVARFYIATRGVRCSLAELLDLVAPDAHDPERASA